MIIMGYSMKLSVRIQAVFFAAVVLLLACSGNVIAADRIITEKGTCSPLVSFQVVTEAVSVSVWEAQEILPFGLTPSNIKGRGIWDAANSTITWGPFPGGVNRLLSYEITGTPDTYTLSGTLTFDGTPETIAGETEAEIKCTIPLGQTATPEVSPPSGAVVPHSVTITCVTTGARIRYSLNGSVPYPAFDDDDILTSFTYDGTPLSLTSKTSLRVKAFNENMTDSNVVSVLYPEPAPEPSGSVVRTITDNDTCTPLLTLDAAPAASVKSYAVTDYLPVGVTPVNISDDGIFDMDLGTVKWGPFNDNSVRSLTYEVSGPDLSHEIRGIASFDGTRGDTTCDVRP